MTIYVLMDGRLVEKDQAPGAGSRSRGYPAPSVSRMETFSSPVTGKDITSWRERDRDMYRADAVDPRDLNRKPFERRQTKLERMRAVDG